MADTFIKILAHFAIYLFVYWHQLYHEINVSTPSVLRFLSAIHHDCPRYTHAFLEKAQHLWRWISLRTSTRGRLVPRQPWAIKSTTRTELRDENIRGDRCVHWNIGTTLTALCRYNIYHGGYIHWNTDTTLMALPIGNTHNMRCLHLKNKNIFVDVWAFISLFLVSIHIYFMLLTCKQCLAK